MENDIILQWTDNIMVNIPKNQHIGDHEKS